MATKKADETLRQTNTNINSNDTVKVPDEEDNADDVFAIESDDDGSLEAKTPKNDEDVSPSSSTRPVNVASTFAKALTLVPIPPVQRLAVLCLNQLLMLEDVGEE